MKILVIGDAMFDKYTYARNYRQSPEDSDIPVFDVDHEEVVLGGALNVAANIASLSENNQVSYSGIIYRGHWPCQMESVKIEHDLVHFVDYTMIKHRLIDNTRRKQVVRIDHHKRFKGDDVYFMAEIASTKRYKSRLKDFDYIVISDYDKGTVMDFFVEGLDNFDKPIFVDTKKSDLSQWSKLPRCLVKINAAEFERCSNVKSVNLIVTDGKYGSTYSPIDGCVEANVEGQAVENANVIGAGDVYLAALVNDFAFRCGSKVEFTPLHVRAAMAQADFAARASVRSFGTTVVTPKDIEQEIALDDDYRHAG